MILHAQRLLKSLGYDPGPIDGKAGARTVEAIKEFQRRKQFPVNGLVSASLITALDSAKKNDAPRNK
jgi:localization factor PodJL